MGEQRHKMQSRPVCLSVVLVLATAGILESAASALECPQNLVVANKVDDKAYMEKQIACILGPDSGCDEIGLKAKRIGPLVLSDRCPRPMCDACTKKAIRMVVGKMQRHYPGQWHQIQVKLASQRGNRGRR